MSGLWLLLVLGVWAGLSWGLWQGARRLLGSGVVKRSVGLAIVGVAMALWLGVSFWYAGGRTIYYDAEVNRLCRVDGGVKVYEKVGLPARDYERLANKNWVLPDMKRVQPSDQYFTSTETRFIRSGNPEVAKTIVRFVRRSDNKILGEYIVYGRGGGNLAGPWHGSSYLCPDPRKTLGVASQIFIKGE